MRSRALSARSGPEGGFVIRLNRLIPFLAAAAALVKLRFFAGLSLRESAAALAIPQRTADRNWAFARAWLHRKLRDDWPWSIS